MGVLSSSSSSVDVPEVGQGPECDSPKCGPRLAPPDSCVGLDTTSPDAVSDLSDSGGEDDILRKVRSSEKSWRVGRGDTV